jgi:hypothetical protein
MVHILVVLMYYCIDLTHLWLVQFDKVVVLAVVVVVHPPNLGLAKSLPSIFYEVIRLFPKIVASNERFGIAIQKQSDTIADICHGQTVTEETRKN